MELGPDARTGSEHQQPYRFATIAQRKHEQAGASILTAWRFAHHRPAAVIDLTLFSWSGEDHRPRLWYLGSAQLVREAPNALIATLESVVGDQILPDCHGIAISTQTQLDDFPVGFTGARRAHAFEFSGSLPFNPTPKSVITAMAGFAASEPVITSMAGFALLSRLHLPGGHISTPAPLR